MEQYERSRIEALLDRDAELATLWREHLTLEGRINDLNALPHRTPSEQEEYKLLQKRKLAGKDRIAEIVAQLTGG